MGEGIGLRFLMFVILLAISIVYVYRYASKIEKIQQIISIQPT